MRSIYRAALVAMQTGSVRSKRDVICERKVHNDVIVIEARASAETSLKQSRRVPTADSGLRTARLYLASGASPPRSPTKTWTPGEIDFRRRVQGAVPLLH